MYRETSGIKGQSKHPHLLSIAVLFPHVPPAPSHITYYYVFICVHTKLSLLTSSFSIGGTTFILNTSFGGEKIYEKIILTRDACATHDSEYIHFAQNCRDRFSLSLFPWLKNTFNGVSGFDKPALNVKKRDFWN